ncbi:MAG: response regulator transcription factor [Ornithinimicrobium sp.]
MKLLVVDDHVMLAEALAAALSERGHEVCGLAVDPEQATSMVSVFTPDVCLLDAGFPHASGVAAVPALLAASPRTKVLMLSGLTDVVLIREALGHGASGWVSKRQPIAQICDALQTVAEGRVAVDPSMLRDVLSPRADPQDPLWILSFLTPREWQTLWLITRGDSTNQIAQRLGVRSSTAHTHAQSLLTKLGVHTRLQAVAFVHEHAESFRWPAVVRTMQED